MKLEFNYSAKRPRGFSVRVLFLFPSSVVSLFSVYMAFSIIYTNTFTSSSVLIFLASGVCSLELISSRSVCLVVGG